MKFRNYCIVIMGETNGVIAEITKIAETQPNILDAKGILISTFSSVAEPKELTDYFKSFGRNFLIFDLNQENSGFNIIKEEIYNGLFGFLGEMNDENLKQRTDDLIKEISSTTVTNKVNKSNNRRQKSEEKLSISDIDTMTPKDKNELMNKLIDKGVENLSEYDKKILDRLAN